MNRPARFRAASLRQAATLAAVIALPTWAGLALLGWDPVPVMLSAIASTCAGAVGVGLWKARRDRA